MVTSVFKKYPEIENTYRSEVVEELRSLILPDTQFVVTEKIHGAHLVFIVDRDLNTIVATRNRIFNPFKENFHNAKEILIRYNPFLKILVSNIKKWYLMPSEVENLISIQFYGELFGGYYNGDSRGSRVQKGVDYCPWNDFMLFDIQINTSEGSRFLSARDTYFIVSKDYISANVPRFLHVPVLYIGSLDACLTFPTEFLTRVPEELSKARNISLEPIENNIAEGIVIKPLLGDIFNKYNRRIVLKAKNDKFKEKWKAPKIKRTQASKATTEELEYIDKISEYLTENRIDSVVSKGIELSFKNFSVLLKEFLEDALKDAEKDGIDLTLYNKNKLVNKIIKGNAASVLRNKLKSSL